MATQHVYDTILPRTNMNHHEQRQATKDYRIYMKKGCPKLDSLSLTSD